MEPVIKKIEIVISCRELVCAQIAKLKDDIATAEENILQLEQVLNDAKEKEAKQAQEPDRKKCELCEGTGKRAEHGLLFTREVTCWVCEGKGTIPKLHLPSLPASSHWMITISERAHKLEEMKRDLRYLEDQIKDAGLEQGH